MAALWRTLSDTFTSITTPTVLRPVALVVAVVWLGSFVFHQTRASGNLDPRGAAVGGDFLVFYAAGEIVRSGRGGRLYDPEVQREAQAPVLGGQRLGLYYFINPAPFALPYALLALLPFRVAFLLHAALMLLLALWGLRALRPHLPVLQRAWRTTLLLGVSSFPLVHTILGGQNAALALALLCLAYAALQAGNDVRVGLSLGLLLYKPQYAATLLLLLATRRRWTPVAVAGALGLGLYVAGALACGWDWPLRMMQSMGGFYRAHERVANGPTHIAMLEVIEWSLLLPLERGGAPAALTLSLRAAAWLGVGAVLAAVVWRWRDAAPGGARFSLHFALAASATLITSLHAQYYDAALLLLPVLLLVDHHSVDPRTVGGGTRAVLVLVYVIFPLLILGHLSLVIRFQPAALIPVGVAAWAWRSLRGGRA